MAGYAKSVGVPAAKLSVIVSGVLMVVGSLSIILGIWGDLGSLLIVNGQFLVPAGGQVEVPTLSRLLGRLQSGSSVLSGLLHAVGVTVGDDGVAVMQKPVEHADRGGVFG